MEDLPTSERHDESGNTVLGDIAGYLREQITKHFLNGASANDGRPLTMRYFNPGYAIRSVPADASDSVYCVPIPFVTQGSHSVSPDGDLWLSVLESTAQPFKMS